MMKEYLTVDQSPSKVQRRDTKWVLRVEVQRIGAWPKCGKCAENFRADLESADIRTERYRAVQTKMAVQYRVQSYRSIRIGMDLFGLVSSVGWGRSSVQRGGSHFAPPQSRRFGRLGARHRDDTGGL
ncbi:hypothetical protein PGTUg99_026849 [Puccinia graminis f. sp. tritici]|uniref:Uncharacterized protein n=1 Tax=Puccinia graminis f. sp. tritici TaxID=56615 RepID=A0A5B0LRQ6_PUCGR|nr:hypothetical protein PGTUg99_026849 [Puccinia graminis f. sp. tritici]